MKKLVYICSPLRGDLKNNIRKANEYSRKASDLGVIPLAPHAIFTQYLDDNKPEERKKGMDMGLDLLEHCDELWVFGNNITEGMQAEIDIAQSRGMKILYTK